MQNPLISLVTASQVHSHDGLPRCRYVGEFKLSNCKRGVVVITYDLCFTLQILPGSRVAYQMRFDNTRTRHTRILFVSSLGQSGSGEHVNVGYRGPVTETPRVGW